MFRGRDDPLAAEAIEEVEERSVGGLVVGESEQTALGHVGERLDRPAEIGVGVPPRSKFFERMRSQTVLFDDPIPHRAGVGHLLDQRGRLTRVFGRLDPEAFGDDAATSAATGTGPR